MTPETHSHPAKPVVLILGPSGRLGAAAVRAFAAAGWSVVAQSRRPIACLPMPLG